MEVVFPFGLIANILKKVTNTFFHDIGLRIMSRSLTKWQVLSRAIKTSSTNYLGHNFNSDVLLS